MSAIVVSGEGQVTGGHIFCIQSGGIHGRVMLMQLTAGWEAGALSVTHPARSPVVRRPWPHLSAVCPGQPS